MRIKFTTFSLFIILVSLLTNVNIQAQSYPTATVGTYSSTTGYFPLYSCYGYSYSQSIYRSNELSTAGITGAATIYKLRYYLSSATYTTSTYKDFVIYMGNSSTKTTFSSTSDWVSITGMTKVFDNTVTVPTSGGVWVEFTLETPFEYTGGNLIIAFDENTSGYTCTAYWGYFTPGYSGTKSMLYYSDYTNPNPASPPSAYITATYVPAVQLVYNMCSAPKSIAATTTTTTATISWTKDVSTSTIDIEYGEDGFTPGTGTTITTSTSPYTITGLIPNTKYDFYIRQNCSVGSSSQWVQDSFSTTCQIPSILSVTNDSVCDHGMITLFANPSTYATINWYTSDTATVPVATGYNYTTPDISTSTYFYAAATIGNAGTCESSKTAVLAKVNPLPEFGITPAVDTVCTSDPVTYTATYDPDFTYYWSTGDTSRVVTFDEAGTYYLTVTDEKGCSKMDSVRLVNFVTVSADGFDYVPHLFGDPYTVKFSVINPISVYGYKWYFGDGDSSIEATPVHTYPSYGKYLVTLVVSNDCGTDTLKLNISVNKPTSVDEADINNSFKIFPNPTSGYLNIESEQNHDIEHIEIYNALGQKLIAKEVQAQTSRIDVGSLASGQYFIAIYSKQGAMVRKFTINK